MIFYMLLLQEAFMVKMFQVRDFLFVDNLVYSTIYCFLIRTTR